ncbi:hypothetical protein ACFYO1_02125 [Nocardia sp. NPDC006044]|uniref:hypothetical protein n=1 Tax=Nocardia sp. NPDC006044 TaxID=3364306 RepID=UPI0036C0884E
MNAEWDRLASVGDWCKFYRECGLPANPRGDSRSVELRCDEHVAALALRAPLANGLFTASRLVGLGGPTLVCAAGHRRESSWLFFVQIDKRVDHAELGRLERLGISLCRKRSVLILPSSVNRSASNGLRWHWWPERGRELPRLSHVVAELLDVVVTTLISQPLVAS